jgi:signal transduction histidine kinase/competence protein ComGC
MHITLRRSSSFTLAVVFTVVLVMSIVTLLYFMRLTSTTNQQNALKSMIETDMQALVDMHDANGIQALSQLLNYRTRHSEKGMLYALANPDNVMIVGNVAYLPKVNPADNPFFEISMPPATKSDGKPATILAVRTQLSDGYQLMVGRNIPEMEIHQNFTDVLGRAVIGILVFIAAAGFFIGDRVVYRINLIAETASQIMNTGDLSRRIPVPGNWDDLSKLAQILNIFLERIEALMDGVRQVSDNVAHDLRTPLTRIRNHLEMLHDKGEDEQLGIEDCTQKLLEEADELLATFAALLRIGNIESGKWRSNEESVVLDELIHDVIELYEPLAAVNGQEIIASLTPKILQGDKHLLFQAIANLLDNAIKYAPANALIYISLFSEAGETVLRVANTDSYVAPEHLDKLFQRFYRTDTARSNKPGNGLGLSMVKAIVMLHHGHVSAENTKNGFSVTCHFPDAETRKINGTMYGYGGQSGLPHPAGYHRSMQDHSGSPS